MFNHITLGSNDLARSKTFYDAVLGTIGAKPGKPDAKGRLWYVHNGGRLLITKPVDGQAATGANGGTVAFVMGSPEEAQAWHAAGVANGGTSVEDPPGVRQGETGPIYLAYLRDPDGNKICGVHRIAS